MLRVYDLGEPGRPVGAAGAWSLNTLAIVLLRLVTFAGTLRGRNAPGWSTRRRGEAEDVNCVGVPASELISAWPAGYRRSRFAVIDPDRSSSSEIVIPHWLGSPGLAR